MKFFWQKIDLGRAFGLEAKKWILEVAATLRSFNLQFHVGYDLDMFTITLGLGFVEITWMYIGTTDDDWLTDITAERPVPLVKCDDADCAECSGYYHAGIDCVNCVHARYFEEEGTNCAKNLDPFDCNEFELKAS